MLCALILGVSGGVYSLTSTSKDNIFKKPAMSLFIYLFRRNIVFIFLLNAWPGLGSRDLRLISQYTKY